MTINGNISSANVEDARNNSSSVKFRTPVLKSYVRFCGSQNFYALPNSHAAFAVLHTNPGFTAALQRFFQQLFTTSQHLFIKLFRASFYRNCFSVFRFKWIFETQLFHRSYSGKIRHSAKNQTKRTLIPNCSQSKLNYSAVS